MALNSNIISNFVKSTKDDNRKNNKETIVYGELIKQENDTYYVRIDGSTVDMPIAYYTTTVDPAERVTVMIKNHRAVITGNITSPASSSAYVKRQLNNKASRTDVTALQESVTELTTKIDSAENTIAELINDHNEDFGNLQNRINEKAGQGDVDDLSEQCTYLAERVGEMVNDHNEDFGNLSRDIQVHSQEIEDLQNRMSNISGGSSLYKCLGRHTLSLNGYVDISSYMSQYDELMIVVRTVVSSATTIGVSNATSGSGGFLASASVTGTLYTKITLNKTDEGNYACNVGNSFGWATSSAYKYIRNYSAGSDSVSMTVVVHGR